MRVLVHKLLVEALVDDVPADRIFSAGKVDQPPVFPFAVHRYRSGTPTPSGRPQPSLEVWIYDEPGSYLKIDRLLRKVQVRFAAVEDLWSLYREEHISTIDWTSDSPDLPAEEYGGITRNSTYTLTGSST